MALIPDDIPTYLAWRFDSVVPGSFRRNKADYAHIDFPILAPLPTRKASTPPIEGGAVLGPFIYFVVDASQSVHYVGKSEENTVVKRWVRPGIGGPSTHYWTHTNKMAGCIRRIAEGIQRGGGPFQLRFAAASNVPAGYISQFVQQYPSLGRLDQTEKGFMALLRPAWNDPKSYR